MKKILPMHAIMHVGTEVMGPFGDDGGVDLMGDVIVMEQIDIKIDEPSEYRIVLYNDDVTPLEFVLIVLIAIFQKNEIEAIGIMRSAENAGKTTVGVYSYDIAKSLVAAAKEMISQTPFPLKFDLEKVKND